MSYLFFFKESNTPNVLDFFVTLTTQCTLEKSCRKIFQKS